MALNKNAQGNERFNAKSAVSLRKKAIKSVIKYGMSKDSPFLTKYTYEHPSTLKILDYDSMNKLPVKQ